MSSEQKKVNKEQNVTKEKDLGYESVIPKEIKEELLKISEDVREVSGSLISYLSQNFTDSKDLDDYQMIQVVSVLDETSNLLDCFGNIRAMLLSMDKEIIDELAKEHYEGDVKKFRRNHMKAVMLKMALDF